MFGYTPRGGARRGFGGWVARMISREMRSAGERWSAGLTDGYALLSAVINVACLGYMLNWAFEQSVTLGVSFTFASCFAVLRAYILNHPLVLIMVGISVAIGNLILPQLRGDAWEALNEGQIAVAVVLFIAYLYFDQFRKRLRRGELDFSFLETPRARRRAPVRHRRYYATRPPRRRGSHRRRR